MKFNVGFKKSQEWMTRKELLDVYDESEAEEMLESGAIDVRQNPKNANRLQFRVEKEKSETGWDFNQSLSLDGKSELSGQQHANACLKMKK